MGTPEATQERPRDPQKPPESLQDPPRNAPGTPRDLPRTPRDRPKTPQRCPAMRRDASGPPKEPPRTAQGGPRIARARARSQKSSQIATREAQDTKISSQAIPKEAKHPRASCPQVFLSVSSFPSAHVFGEGGNTPTRVIPTDLVVSFPLPRCSSLLRKGATHPRASHQQVFLSISCFPPAQFIPLRALGCGGPAQRLQ